VEVRRVYTLRERTTPVSLHGLTTIALELPDSRLDVPADTSRTVAQMHYSGRVARTPALSDHERTAIVNGTATTLLPRLAADAPVDMGRTVGTDNGRSK
jgi:hypothetical protein